MELCAATNRAGVQCRKPRTPGAAVCHMHGSKAPRTRAKAQARVAIRELLDRELTDEERRHPWEIVKDALDRLDAVMRGGQFDTGGAYVEHVVQVVKMGKLILDAGVADKIALARTREIEVAGLRLANDFVAVLNTILDGLPLEPKDREPTRQWALACVQAMFSSRPMPPKPGRVVDVAKIVPAL